MVPLNTDGGQDLCIELSPVAAPAPAWQPRPGAPGAVIEQAGAGVAAEPEVFLHVGAVETMFADALSHRRVETGGLLVGQLWRDDAGCYTRVTAALPAAGAQRDAVSLTFTHEAWAQMLRAREEEHPDQQVVGWYHTHPGLRVFLSPADRFIHQSFFPRPQDIAAVLDLERREWGIFRWDDGDLALAGRFFVYADRGDETVRLSELLKEFTARGGGGDAP